MRRLGVVWSKNACILLWVYIVVDVIGPIAIYLPYALFLFGAYGTKSDLHCYTSEYGYPAHPVFEAKDLLNSEDYILTDVTAEFRAAINFGSTMFFLNIVAGLIMLVQVRRQIIKTSETDLM